MKVLVTGATGFVGSHVARELLRRGHDVIAAVRPRSKRARLVDVEHEIRFVEVDVVADSSVAAAANPEACIHAAWYTNPSTYLVARENIDFVGAGARLAFALADGGCRRFVGVGTCFEYDVEHGRLSEATPTGPRHLYSASKLALATLLEQVAALTGLSVAWARLFYLYGPWEHERRLVASVARALLQGRRIETTPGEQVRDYLHVGDVAAALVDICEADVAGPVNVGSGARVTVREVVQTLAVLAGRPDLVALGARPYAPGDPMMVYAENNRLRSSTRWRGGRSLEVGLSQTLDWWRSGNWRYGIPDE